MAINRPLLDAGQPRGEVRRTWPLGLLAAISGTLGILGLVAFAGLPLSPLTWYLARASGLTLYLTLWVSVVTGLGLTTRLLDPLAGRFGVWQFHRIVTEVSFALLATHMISLALDTSVSLGLRGVLVPFASDVRQPWTDLGIISGWFMVLIAASFAVRHVLGHRGWRALHYASFPLWLIAWLHGIGAGSDSGRPWAILLYTVTAAIIAFLTLYRILRVGSTDTVDRSPTVWRTRRIEDSVPGMRE